MTMGEKIKQLRSGASICIYDDCRVTLLNKYTLTSIYA